MSFEEFFPTLLVGSLVAATSICRFENQRWTRARVGGLRGSSEGFGLFVDLTGLASLVFSLVFVFAFLFDFGWETTLRLVAVSFGASLVYSVLSTKLFGGDNLALRLLGTFALWPLMVVLGMQVSWFGVL